MKENYDLSRFRQAHEEDYARALEEIRNGRKRTHWMWYIFPQLRGLGESRPAYLYGIVDLNEAEAFLRDPFLGKNLKEICEALLGLPTDNALDVFEPVDVLKLRSSMTLFARAENTSESVFEKVLKKYFDGQEDMRTLEKL